MWGCIILRMSTKPTAKAIAAAERVLQHPSIPEDVKDKARAVLRRNNLPKVQPVPLDELMEKRTRKTLEGSTRGRRHASRRPGPPPSPKGKTAAEIAEMDPDSDEFKYKRPDGSPMKRRIPLEEREKRGFRSVVNMDKQNRANARRANIRKYEAEIVAAQREHSTTGLIRDAKTFEVVEAQMVAAGEVSFDDWTDEELIRGYRKNRNGKFGPPPKWVAQEVVQELHRRILKRGGKKMLTAYLESVDMLIELAQTASSEKVRLEAVKELQNRVSGKVPDRIAVSADDPWQDMLADSYVLPSELPPLDVEGSKRDAPAAPPSGPPTAGDEAGSSSGVEARSVPPQPQIPPNGKVGNVQILAEDLF